MFIWIVSDGFKDNTQNRCQKVPIIGQALLSSHNSNYSYPYQEDVELSFPEIYLKKRIVTYSNPKVTYRVSHK